MRGAAKSLSRRAKVRLIEVDDLDSVIVLSSSGKTELLGPTRIDNPQQVCVLLLAAALQNIIHGNEDMSLRNSIVTMGNAMEVPEIAIVLVNAIEASLEARDNPAEGAPESVSA
jgi:hypothetical protein